MQIRRFAVAFAAFAFMLTGCAAPTVEGDPSIVIDMIESRFESTTRLQSLPSTLAEALPNQVYRDVDTGKEFSVSTGAVLGRVASATVIDSWTLKDGEAVEVALDDSTVLWRMVDVVVEVERAWGDVAGSKEVHVTIPLDGAIPIDLGTSAMVNLGRVFLVLNEDRIYENEALLGTVASDGTVAFVNDGLDEPLFSGAGLDTVAELTEALDARPATIEMRYDKGIPLQLAEG
jgi:hypothetical protein